MNIKFDKNMRARIFLIGCGGTGSQLISSLMQLCNNLKDRVDSITLIDGDFYENKNLQNQKCTEDEIGINKAEAMTERYSCIFEDLKIYFVDNYIKSTEDLTKITNIRGYDLDHILNIIIGCVDNNSTRKILNDTFHKWKQAGASCVYIDSGNGDNERCGQIITGYTFKNEVLLNPIGHYFPEILNDNDLKLNANSCQMSLSDNPQNIATNVMASSILLSIMTNLLKFDKIEKGIIYFDADKINVISR